MLLFLSIGLRYSCHQHAAPRHRLAASSSVTCERWQYCRAERSLPPMSAEERRSLRNDLVMHGLRVPIIRRAGMVLDGWYRYQLCIEESIEPRFEDYADDDPFGLVRSLNLSRRHLTLAQKKEVAKHIFEREPGRSDRSVGEELGLSHTTVAKVREEVDAEPNGQNGHKDSSAATPVASNSQNGNKKDVRVECDGDHHARISQDRSQARSVLSAGKETPRPAGHFR